MPGFSFVTAPLLPRDRLGRACQVRSRVRIGLKVAIFLKNSNLIRGR